MYPRVTDQALEPDCGTRNRGATFSEIWDLSNDMIPRHYQTEPGFDPAEDYIGPFYFSIVDSHLHFAFAAEQKNCNAHGIVHGGVLMTFADYCLCMAATNHYDGESCITVSFSCEFAAGAEIGSLVECDVEVTRKTGSMVFLTGKIFVGETIVVTFSSVVKRLRET